MSLQDDIAAVVDRFGAEDVGLVWGLAMTHWESSEARDAFLDAAKTYGMR